MPLSTSTTARCRILSSSAATPSGRKRPSAFGMYALLVGFARFPAVDPLVQVAEVVLQVLPVGLPRHVVDAGRGPRVQRPIGLTEPVNIDVVQERGEPCLLVR